MTTTIFIKFSTIVTLHMFYLLKIVTYVVYFLIETCVLIFNCFKDWLHII